MDANVFNRPVEKIGESTDNFIEATLGSKDSFGLIMIVFAQGCRGCFSDLSNRSIKETKFTFNDDA